VQGDGDFVEVYVNSPLEVCERRDPKGLYARARAGEIKDFTGVSDSAPYEAPETAELELRTDLEDPAESADRVIAYLKEHGYLDGVDV
jgi:adenylylsulfate kinase-like enzyme